MEMLPLPQGDAKLRCCKVPGCSMSFGAKSEYAWKHRMCNFHREASAVVLDGMESRWCQSCTKFEPASYFQGDKRRCAKLLDKLRRKRKAAKALEVDSTGEDCADDCVEYDGAEDCVEDYMPPTTRKRARKLQQPSTPPASTPQQHAAAALPQMLQLDDGIPGIDNDVQMPLHNVPRRPRSVRTRRASPATAHPFLPLPHGLEYAHPGAFNPMPDMQQAYPMAGYNVDAAPQVMPSQLGLPLPDNLGLAGVMHGYNNLGAVDGMNYQGSMADATVIPPMPPPPPLPHGFGFPMAAAGASTAWPPAPLHAGLQFPLNPSATVNLHMGVDPSLDTVTAPSDLYGLWRASAGGASAGGAPQRGISVGGASLEEILFGSAFFGGAAIEPPRENDTNASMGQGSNGQMHSGSAANIHTTPTSSTSIDSAFSDEDVLCPMSIKPQGADEWRMANGVQYMINTYPY